MKRSLLFTALLSAFTLQAAQEAQIQSVPEAMQAEPTTLDQTNNVTPTQECAKGITPLPVTDSQDQILKQCAPMLVSVVGQGVAPMHTSSPAQAYALAKRAAIADAYRLIAEKVKGVRVDGQDLIKNMMVKRSTVRTSVQAMVRNSNIVETNYKEGLCEVEMEILISYAQFQ